MVVADAASGATPDSGLLATLMRLEGALALPEGAAAGMHARLRTLDRGEPTSFALVLDASRPEVHVGWSVLDRTDTAARMREWFGPSVCDAIQRALPQMPILRCAARLWPIDRAWIEVVLAVDGEDPLRGPARVEALLAAVGLPGAWCRVADAMARGPEVDEVHEVSLRRADAGCVRVDVSVRHRSPTHDVVVAGVRAAGIGDPDRVARFYYRVTDGARPGAGLAPATSMGFLVDRGSVPVATTLRIPIRAFVDHDADLCGRIDQLGRGGQHANLGGARLLGADDCHLLRVGAAAIHERLDDAHSRAIGLVTLSAGDEGERVIVELSSSDAAPIGESDLVAGLAQLLRRYESTPLAAHPFVRRVQREAGDLRHVWLLLENMYASFSRHSPRRLAGVIARVDDDRLRSLLARQLDRELGSGDFTRSRRQRLRQLLDTVERERPARLDSRLLQPGTRLSVRLDAIHADEHPYVGVGAVVVRQLCARQITAFVAERFQAQGDSAAHASLLDVLPLDPPDESTAVAAALLHDDQQRAASRGGRAVHAAVWAALDDMYRLCFSA